MTTPQETRDRIEEMRNRIFNGSNLDSVKNKIESDSVIEEVIKPAKNTSKSSRKKKKNEKDSV